LHHVSTTNRNFNRRSRRRRASSINIEADVATDFSNNYLEAVIAPYIWNRSIFDPWSKIAHRGRT
jgi:hypothetical protein